MVVGSGRRARTAPHIVLFDHAQPQAGRDTLKEFADDERAYETANAWVPWLQLARAAHWRMRGDYAAARAEYANCLQNHDSAASTRGQFWPKATAGMIETLTRRTHRAVVIRWFQPRPSARASSRSGSASNSRP
jgi:hypothetical protein